MKGRINIKKSKYNILIPYDDNNYIIFNSLSGAIGKFDKKTVDRFESDSYLQKFTSSEIELLIQKGILINDEYDELEKITQDRIAGIEKNNVKHIRIWTTSACNAKCYYCFEKGIETSVLEKRTAQNILEYVDNILNIGDHLQIEWFGGEPLLNINMIDYISMEITKIIQRKNGHLHVSIITNGSLISQEIASKMRTLWNVNNVQITLDGFADYYNKVKDYNDTKMYNFEKVISNIDLLISRGIHVAIRMNYVSENYDSLKELIIFLGEHFRYTKNISYYIYPIWSSLNGDYISEINADSKLVELYKVLVKLKMASFKSLARLNYRKHQCKSCGKYSINIFPDGS